jgi:hypothetical protein
VKMIVSLDVAPCSLVEVYRRFGGAYRNHYQGDHRLMTEGVSTSETQVTSEVSQKMVILT